VVLVDSRGQKVVPVEDGEIALRRRVVVVEDQGKLILGLDACLVVVVVVLVGVRALLFRRSSLIVPGRP
jgi:hypothetical protein